MAKISQRPIAQKLEAIRLREHERLSMQKISRLLDVPHSTVRGWVGHIEIPDQQRSPFRWTEAHRDEAKLLYKAGWSMKAVAKFTGVPAATIADWLRADPEIEMRRTRDYKEHPPKTPHKVIDLVRRLYVQEQMSATEIGKILGRHPTTVRKLLIRHGTPLRDRSEYIALWHRRRRETVVDLGGTMAIDSVDQSIALGFLENDHGPACVSSLLGHHPLVEELMLKGRTLLAEFDDKAKVLIRDDGAIIPLQAGEKT